MNFQQLRSVRETVRYGFNLTEVATILFTSQPGVSRQIRELEDELGVEIFARAGKRLTGLTPPGEALLPIVERLLLDADNLKRAGQDFTARMDGRLSVAATHSQARYALPHVVRDFRLMFPQVTLHLHQGSPKQVAEMLLSGEADIGVATEALALYPQLVTLPCYRWTHSIVVPPGHPLLDHPEPVTLRQLSPTPSSPTTWATPGAPTSTTPLPAKGCVPTWCSPPWTPTSSRPMWSWAWAWASSPRLRSTRSATATCACSTRATCSRST